MHTTTRRRIITAVMTALVGLAFSNPGWGHHAVLRFNLEEMTQTADRIFLGRCIEAVESEEMIARGMLPVTRYTFEVERVIKGTLPRRVTFMQLGHSPRSAFRKQVGPTVHGEVIGTGTFIHGMSEYSVGERVVLFLIPDYLDGKVTYPVGLYQGAFKVSTMPSGQELVRNSINNLGLFSAPYNGTKMSRADAKLILRPFTGSAAIIDELSQKRGALPLEKFLEAVSQIHSAHAGQKGAIVQ
jgi:hypothetical protein